MRKIKFRAWDGEKMISESRRDDYDDYYTLDLDGTFYGHTRTGDEWFNASKDELNKRPYSLLQFTGLIAMDGKEIYEGDIVTHKQSPYPCQIIFKQRQAQFMARELTGYHAKVWQIIEKKVRSVIGNIYENPELLSDTEQATEAKPLL